MKKFIYPLIFSVGFLAFWFITVEILNATDGDGYGALGVGMLCLIAWIIVGIPIHCIRYSKLIVEEKGKYLFEIYNFLLIAALHVSPFASNGEAIVEYPFIFVCFWLWVLFWSMVPLTWRVLSRKYEQEDAEEENGEEVEIISDEELRKNSIRIAAIVFVFIYIASLIFSRGFAEFVVLQNFPYILPMVEAAFVAIALLYEKKNFWLKKQMYTVAFCANATYILLSMISGFKNIDFYIEHPVLMIQFIPLILRLVAVGFMIFGSLNDFKRAGFVKYGAIAVAALLAVSSGGVMLSMMRIELNLFIYTLPAIMFYVAIACVADCKKTNKKIEA